MPSDSRAKGSAKLLVVDDDPATLEALSTVLTEAGYTVSLARGGDDALHHLDSQTTLPDLLLVDLMMPNGSGWDLTDGLREHPDWRDLPIVYMTAGGSTLLARAPVAVGYLNKPIEIDRLLQVVRRAIETARARKLARLGSGTRRRECPDGGDNEGESEVG